MALWATSPVDTNKRLFIQNTWEKPCTLDKIDTIINPVCVASLKRIAKQYTCMNDTEDTKPESMRSNECENLYV